MYYDFYVEAFFIFDFTYLLFIPAYLISIESLTLFLTLSYQNLNLGLEIATEIVMQPCEYLKIQIGIWRVDWWLLIFPKLMLVKFQCNFEGKFFSNFIVRILAWYTADSAAQCGSK